MFIIMEGKDLRPFLPQGRGSRIDLPSVINTPHQLCSDVH